MPKFKEHTQDDLYPWLTDSFKELVNQSLPQAMLLHGPANIGKLEFGLALAKYLLCESAKKSDFACNACNACHWFNSGNHPDFIPVLPEDLAYLLNFSLLDSENNKNLSSSAEDKKLSKVIRIEQIRNTISSLEIGAHRGNKKIVLIYPVEAMQGAAANSLLKSLEEPPKNVMMILISHQVDKVIATIKSRCRLIPIGPPTFDVGLEWLKNRLSSLGVSVEKINAVYRENGGAVLKTVQQLENNTSSLSDFVLEYLINPGQIQKQNISEIMSKIPMKDLILILQKWVLDLTMLTIKLPPKFYPKQVNILSKQISKISKEKLFSYSDLLASAQKISEHPLNNKIQAERLFLEYGKLFH